MNDLARGRHLPAIDYAYLEETMLQLLAIPSPVGQIGRASCRERV